MDFQVGFNVAISLAGFLGGYVLKSLNESLKSLASSDRILAEKVQSIEVLVAGKYVTREDLQLMGNDIFNVLRRIEDKIEKKADK